MITKRCIRAGVWLLVAVVPITLAGCYDDTAGNNGGLGSGSEGSAQGSGRGGSTATPADGFTVPNSATDPATPNPVSSSTKATP